MTQVGMPFKIFDGDVSPFRLEVAKRIGEINEAAGLPSDWPVPAADRARVRTAVAREFFLTEHGRKPVVHAAEHIVGPSSDATGAQRTE